MRNYAFQSRNAFKADFYVSSADGSDSYNGKYPVRRGGTNGPLLTVGAALTALAAATNAKVIAVLNGSYFENSITIGSGCSNKVLMAYPGHRPVISAGNALSGWADTGSNIWTINPGATPNQLVVNGVKMREKRRPNYDSADPIRNGWAWATGTNGTNTITYSASDFTNAQILAGMYVLIHYQSGYGAEILHISSIDYGTHTITFDSDVQGFPDAGSRFFVFGGTTSVNFDQAGEWWYNGSNLLTYQHTTTWDGRGAVIGVGARNTFNLDGVSGFRIQGITFTDNSAMDTNNDIGSAVINSTSGNNNVIDANIFKNVSQVLRSRDVTGTLFARNTVDTTLSAAIDGVNDIGLVIINNRFRNIAQWYAYNGAVQGYESYQWTVSHNEFDTMPRMAISFTDDDAGHSSGGHLIEYNKISNAMLETDDAGAIYSYASGDGSHTGSTCRYNSIRGSYGLMNDGSTGFADLDGGNTHGAGIYCDNRVSNWLIYGNFICGTTEGSMHIHGGLGNEITNNIMVEPTYRGMYFEEDGDNGAPTMTGTKFQKNIVEIVGTVVGVDNTVGKLPTANVNTNIYYDTTLVGTYGWGPGGAGSNLSFAAWKALGYDASGSTVQTDVGFTDPASGNYRDDGTGVRPSGFVELPWDLMGPQG